jgi:hypothetical protein
MPISAFAEPRPRLLDDERHQSTERGGEEARRQPLREGKPEQDFERQVPRAVDHGQRADDREAREVGDQHHLAPVVAVGERSSDEHGQQQADALKRQHVAE